MSYVCELCKEVILPVINYEDDRVIYSIEAYEIRGGLGNKTIYQYVCPECQKKLSFLKEGDLF